MYQDHAAGWLSGRGHLEVGLRQDQVAGAGEAGCSGLAEVGGAGSLVGLAEAGLTEVGGAEVGFAEVGGAEVGLIEVGGAESLVGFAEVGGAGSPESLAEVGGAGSLVGGAGSSAGLLRSWEWVCTSGKPGHSGGRGLWRR